MMRHHLDYYKTPAFAVDVLLRHFQINSSDTILDPCAGNGEISDLLRNRAFRVITNDIDKSKITTDYHFDASRRNEWHLITRGGYIITNPPFNIAFDILKNAYDFATVAVAFILRLSFLEPTYDRQKFLQEHPPTTLIVLPRISFTGDGKTDSVTCAWMIWDKTATEQKIIISGKEK